MARAGLRRTAAAVALAGLAAGCGLRGTEEGAGGLRLSFEDIEQPGVFRREAPGRRDAPGGAAGAWAVVAGLPRPERGLVENLETGARTTVALFAGGGGEVRLSNAAADALGIGARPVPVRVTALRREPQIVPPRDGF